MSSTAAKHIRSRPKPRPAASSKGVRKFWIRAQNADLDRAGDLLLKNLSVMRRTAPSRGRVV